MAYVSPTNIEDLAKKMAALTFSEMMSVCRELTGPIVESVDVAMPEYEKPPLMLKAGELASAFSDWSRIVCEVYAERAKGE